MINEAPLLKTIFQTLLLVDNGYDLSINKYKKIEYVAVEYPPTQEILANLRKLSVQIDQEIAELEKLLNQ